VESELQRRREQRLELSRAQQPPRVDVDTKHVVPAPSQAGSRNAPGAPENGTRDPHTALVAVCRLTRGTGEARSSSIVPPGSAPDNSTTVPEAVTSSPMLAWGAESDSKGTSNVATSTEPNARRSTVRSQLGIADLSRADQFGYYAVRQLRNEVWFAGVRKG
jgi:hypothetical protein